MTLATAQLSSHLHASSQTLHQVLLLVAVFIPVDETVPASQTREPSVRMGHFPRVTKGSGALPELGPKQCDWRIYAAEDDCPSSPSPEGFCLLTGHKQRDRRAGPGLPGVHPSLGPVPPAPPVLYNFIQPWCTHPLPTPRHARVPGSRLFPPPTPLSLQPAHGVCFPHFPANPTGKGHVSLLSETRCPTPRDCSRQRRPGRRSVWSSVAHDSIPWPPLRCSALRLRAAGQLPPASPLPAAKRLRP